MHPSRRAVITGAGAICALGATPSEIWERLVDGETGLKPISRFDAGRFASRLAGEIDDSRVELRSGALDFEMRRMASFVRFAVHAGEAALADAGFGLGGLPDRGAIHLGVAMGGLPNIEAGILRQESRGPLKTSPYLIPSLIPSMAVSMLALRNGFAGPQMTFAGACAAGSQAIGGALDAIRRGDCLWVLAGGSEAVTTPITFSGFEAMHAVSVGGDPSAAPRPFDRRRDGFIVGEGAAAFMIESLERARSLGRTIYAEISGVGSSTGAADLVVQTPDSVARCMMSAIRDAGLAPDDIDGIYAQGSGSRGDDVELEAIRRVFGQRRDAPPPITSIKAHTGYTFAANGPLNVLAAVMALRAKTLSPTRNFEKADFGDGTVDVVTSRRPFAARHCLVNALGFGGVNSSLVVSSLSDA
jgi:3-oxoacyl-[acyl-carrier-protein] synthase II